MFGRFLHVFVSPVIFFATCQRIECKQDLASLAPKGCFIAAQAVEREIGQISETQKAPRELNGRINRGYNRIRLGGLHGLYWVWDAVTSTRYKGL
jgi:hypothetical protein